MTPRKMTEILESIHDSTLSRTQNAVRDNMARTAVNVASEKEQRVRGSRRDESYVFKRFCWVTVGERFSRRLHDVGKDGSELSVY